MATVNIVSIFTRGARSSDTPELCTARAQADIRRANEVWNTGFPPGISCDYLGSSIARKSQSMPAQ